MIEEIKLRGHVMTMSADLEFTLLKIIVACVADTPTKIVREYKTLPLEAKIAMLKHDLKTYKNKQFVKYKTTINRLDKIKKFRNKFAHCKIVWDKKQKDTSFFNILIISDIEGREKPQLIKMTYTEFYKKSDQIRMAILELLELYLEIEKDFAEKYPNFFKEG